MVSEKIRELAEKYRDYTAQNLSKLVQTKSYSSKEEDVCKLLVKLCEEAGFDEVKIDDLGSVVGRVGNGPKKLAFDAHIDTVEVGNLKNWDFDPGSDTRFGANLGAGAEYAITDVVALTGELKYMLTGDYRQLATLVGVTFKF